jgi:hypothetical protein
MQEPHQNFYPEPLKNDATPQHCHGKEEKEIEQSML